MGFEVDNHHEPNSTPKLTLYKLPYSKPRQPPVHMQTPPLRPPLSVPFRWEVSPGNPRAAAAHGGATPPCLDLPPRLMLHDDAKITVKPSPDIVLDGPYVGRSLSLACTFSLRKGPVLGREDGPKPNKRGAKFGSGRYEGKFERGTLDISRSLGEIFESEKDVKIRRVGKRRFFGISSNLWGNICASFKQAVPWRRSR